MMGYYYGPGMPAWMWLMGAVTMLLLWGGLGLLAVWAIRSLARRDGGSPADEILARRLATGEISQEEYERTRKVLHG